MFLQQNGKCHYNNISSMNVKKKKAAKNPIQPYTRNTTTTTSKWDIMANDSKQLFKNAL